MSTTYTNSGNIEVKLQSAYTKVKSADASPVENINKVLSRKYTYGNTANLAQVSFFLTQSIAATGTFTLDLQALTSEIGGTLTLVKLSSIVIEHASTSNTANVNVGNAATNAFTGWLSSGTATIPLTPGGIIAHIDLNKPLTVASNNKSILFTNLDAVNAAEINIHVVGNIS